MTDTIDDVPAAPVEQEPAGPAIDEQGCGRAVGGPGAGEGD
jgi:hypothetical protein